MRLEDKFRRKRDADDLQSLARPVNGRVDFIPRLESVRIGEGFADSWN